MSKFDLYIANCIKSETANRLKFFNENADKIYEQINPQHVSKHKERYAKLKEEIKEANTTINQMIEELRAEKKSSDPGFDIQVYKAKMSAKFPELSDPRCYTHSMRPVPVEHLYALYDNTEGRGTDEYLKLRWSVPPNKRFYFPLTTNWEYGWHAPDPSNEPYYGRESKLQTYIWRKNTLAMFVKDKQLPVNSFV